MIFYFSGTGNTRWAAKQISEKTNEKLVDITKEIGKHTTYKLDEGELIGFCFPIHGWRPPLIMRKFIEQLCIENIMGHYCFALCTTGDNVGEAIKIFRKDLEKQGLHLDSAFSLIMPESYVGLPFMDVDTPVNEAKKKQNAAVELSSFIKLIIKREKNVEKLTIGKWPRINSRFIGMLFTKYMINDKPFHTTEKKCINCRVCAKSCPVNNIIMNDKNMPQWKHDGSCLTCFSCYHHCPKHAIEFGSMTKNKGQYYFKSDSDTEIT